MTTESTTSASGAVRPSAVVRFVAPLRNALNPVIVRLAGKRRFAMAARLEHVGRRSGRTYLTPVTTRPLGDAVFIALTFGNQSDWVRNVLAAGGCKLRIDGTDCTATDPELVSWQDAKPAVRSAFGPLERTLLHAFGVKLFIRMTVRRDDRASRVPAAAIGGVQH